MLEIRLSNQAGKFLKKLVPKHRKQVAGKIKELMSNPLPHDSKTVRGHPPYMRADIGEYRLIYKTQDDRQLLLVAIIGKRNDDHVYKLFQRFNA